jgi:hypothetical protein
MTLHLGYPTVTKGHKLIGVTHVAKPTELTGIPPVAKLRTMPTGFPPAVY